MKSKLLSFFSLSSLLLSLNLHASEKDIYEFSWLDPDKEVYVLQNRKFRKAEHLYVNLGAGITTSGAFVDSTSIQGRAGYFISEDWGIEVLYAKNNGKENDNFKAVRATSNGTGSTPFRRIVESYTGGMIVWSPFYSKINTFNKIVYMDWIFGLGVAQLQEHNNKTFFATQSLATETTEKHTGLIWSAGMKFFLDEDWSLRADLTGMHYQATQVTLNKDTYYSNFDATLSLGYTF
jgi:outer membrane beta-barrel protein